MNTQEQGIGAILTLRIPHAIHNRTAYVSFGEPRGRIDTFGVPLSDIDEFVTEAQMETILDELFQNTFEVMTYHLVYRELQ